MRQNRTAERRPCAVLVNDDAEVERLLASSLAPELEFHAVSTIQQARALLDDLRCVDLAFLDLELPEGNADELLERLARWPDAIRVLLANALLEREATPGWALGRGLRHRHLVHLVLCKPPALEALRALKSMVLDLPGV